MPLMLLMYIMYKDKARKYGITHVKYSEIMNSPKIDDRLQRTEIYLVLYLQYSRLNSSFVTESQSGSKLGNEKSVVRKPNTLNR